MKYFLVGDINKPRKIGSNATPNKPICTLPKELINKEVKIVDTFEEIKQPSYELDEDGKVLFIDLLDKNGETITTNQLDLEGNVIKDSSPLVIRVPKPKLDENGEPIFTIIKQFTGKQAILDVEAEKIKQERLVIEKKEAEEKIETRKNEVIGFITLKKSIKSLSMGDMTNATNTREAILLLRDAILTLEKELFDLKVD